MLLSKSSIRQYKTCPQSFKFGHIDKLKAAENKLYQKGTDIHELCSDFFGNYIYENGFVSPNFKIPEKYETELGFFLERESKRYQYLMKNDRLDIFEPYLKEKFIRNTKYGIHGIPDRIDKTINNNYVLYEYKTGYVNTRDIAKELGFYLLLMDKIDIKVFKLYEFKKQRVLNISVNKGIVTEVEKDINNVKDKINNQEFKPVISDNGCFWCGYKAYCEEILKL